MFKSNISLKPYNTFGLDCIADKFAILDTVSKVKLVTRILKGEKILFLGGGSNLLFLSNKISRPVLKNNLLGIECVKETEEHVWIKAMAGEIWHDLVMYCVQHNYGGIENLSLIPGSVGAAPMQNIGAYGVEIKDTFDSLEAVNLRTGQLENFDIYNCDFGYRNSVFKGRLKGEYCIVSMTLKLNKKPVINTSYGAIANTLSEMNIKNPSIKTVSDAVIKIRQSKLPDPIELGNAGSFFKNPVVDKSLVKDARFKDAPMYEVNDIQVKIPAGWLIEQCGWKGKVVGETGCHKDQALVIVNYGKATGDEIWNHALNVKQSVLDKYDIELEPEVNIVK